MTGPTPQPGAHTPEPWTADIPYIHAGDTATIIGECFDDDGIGVDQMWANARRIVACVNALAGWTTEGIETFAARHMPIKDAIDDCNKNHRSGDAAVAALTRQRDELLGEVRMFLSRPFMPGPEGGRHIAITDEQWLRAAGVIESAKARGTAVQG